MPVTILKLDADLGQAERAPKRRRKQAKEQTAIRPSRRNQSGDKDTAHKDLVGAASRAPKPLPNWTPIPSPVR